MRYQPLEAVAERRVPEKKTATMRLLVRLGVGHYRRQPHRTGQLALFQRLGSKTSR